MIVLVETPSELEKQIGIARRAVTASYLDARAQVQGVVSRWIGVEQAVESASSSSQLDCFICLLTSVIYFRSERLKSLVAPDEPLTPGVLYVGVATLTGSVFARNRMLAARLLLPPTLFVLSFNHFLPKTAHNVSAYFGFLEETHFPTFAEKHEIAKAHSAMTWERIKDATSSGQEKLTSGVQGVLTRLEDVTGLKIKETLGWGEGAVKATDIQAKQVAKTVESEANAATSVVAQKVEDAEQVVTDKVDAAEKKVEEQPKRLV